MDIPALSMAMAKNQLTMDFGVAMLSKSLDLSSQIGDSLTQCHFHRFFSFALMVSV